MQNWALGPFYGELWGDGIRTAIDTPRYAHNTPLAINELGHISGFATNSADASEGFLWADGVLTYLGHVPGGQDWTRPQDINDAGLVVGYSMGEPLNQPFHAITWQNGVLTDLGIIDVGPNAPPYPPVGSQAVNVNNAGQILGFTAWVADVWVYKPWLLRNGELTMLPELPGQEKASIYPVAINEKGAVLGIYGFGQPDAFASVWDPEGIRVLNDLGDARTFVTGLNNLGQVVGASIVDGSETIPPSFRATIWEADGTPSDLNLLVSSPMNGFVLEQANGINDKGWIVGYGATDSGARHGFLLVPVPEPNAVVTCLIGTAFVVASRSVRRLRQSGMTHCASATGPGNCPRRAARRSMTGSWHN